MRAVEREFLNDPGTDGRSSQHRVVFGARESPQDGGRRRDARSGSLGATCCRPYQARRLCRWDRARSLRLALRPAAPRCTQPPLAAPALRGQLGHQRISHPTQVLRRRCKLSFMSFEGPICGLRTRSHRLPRTRRSVAAAMEDSAVFVAPSAILDDGCFDTLGQRGGRPWPGCCSP